MSVRLWKSWWMMGWSGRLASPTSTKTRLRPSSTSPVSNTSPPPTRSNQIKGLNQRALMLKLLSFPPGRVPPIPEPGEADRLLLLQRHLGDGLRLPGLPQEKLVSTLYAQGESVELYICANFLFLSAKGFRRWAVFTGGPPDLCNSSKVPDDSSTGKTLPGSLNVEY